MLAKYAKEVLKSCFSYFVIPRKYILAVGVTVNYFLMKH